MDSMMPLSEEDQSRITRDIRSGLNITNTFEKWECPVVASYSESGRLTGDALVAHCLEKRCELFEDACARLFPYLRHVMISGADIDCIEAVRDIANLLGFGIDSVIQEKMEEAKEAGFEKCRSVAMNKLRESGFASVMGQKKMAELIEYMERSLDSE
jgi:hypothetical protein